VPLTSFTGSFGPHAGRVSDRTPADTTEEMADVCVRRHHEVQDRRLAGRFLRCRSRRSPHLEVTCLCRGACDDGLSFSRDRAHFDAGREDRASARPRAEQRSARFPPSVQRRHRTPESVNAFDPAELVVGPGRGAVRDVSHHEAVTVSSVTWWWNRDPGLSQRPSLGDPLFGTLSLGPEPSTSSGPPRQTTTPEAREASTVRSPPGSLGGPPSRVRFSPERSGLCPEPRFT